MRRMTKCAAQSWVEKCPPIQTLPPTQGSTLYVVDFMMLLRMVCTVTSKCKSFGDLSNTLLSCILTFKAKYFAVVSDVYPAFNSIESGERARRGLIQMQEIHNPASRTPLPKQRQKMLSNPKNKANLAQFIMQDWVNKAKPKLREDQVLYLAGGFEEAYVVGVTHNMDCRVPTTRKQILACLFMSSMHWVTIL